jgi:hypothetical protein
MSLTLQLRCRCAAKLAGEITDVYAPYMPRFFVGIVFKAVSENELFVGGMPARSFVRFVLEHIAREFPNREASRRFLDRINQVIAPYVADRGLDWEIHIDETSFDLWSINGFYPPREGTPDERRWMADNRPSPRTHD